MYTVYIVTFLKIKKAKRRDDAHENNRNFSEGEKEKRREYSYEKYRILFRI